MVASLQIDEGEKEGVHVLKVGGRLDATSSPILRRKLEHLIETPGARVVVDLKGLVYLSSAGMRVMLEASKKLKAIHGAIAFCSAQAVVMDVIKVAGFAGVGGREPILRFYPTEISALTALKPSSKSD